MQEINAPSLPSAAHSISPKELAQEQSVILIAEDDRMTRAMISHILTNDGYQVVETGDGEECLAAYQTSPPNLVLLDAMMPGIDGFECCSELIKRPESIYSPILMITGLEDQNSVDRAFKVGASDYITKPIHWPVLRQRVRIQLERTQLYKQLEEANKKLTHLATIDELTQLPNRRVFSETLQREWQRMARDKEPLSLIIADVDFFKAYNDTYGHLFGDNCLFQVASVMGQCVKRPADTPARYGGEEFAVILPNTPLSGAIHVARTINQAVEALAIPHQKSVASSYVTLSLGVASVVPDPNTMGSETRLILAADKALYEAKEAGRNRVHAADSLQTATELLTDVSELLRDVS